MLSKRLKMKRSERSRRLKKEKLRRKKRSGEE
jgi:hypothetical protein